MLTRLRGQEPRNPLIGKGTLIRLVLLHRGARCLGRHSTETSIHQVTMKLKGRTKREFESGGFTPCASREAHGNGVLWDIRHGLLSSISRSEIVQTEP